MRFDILTIFPEFFQSPFAHGMSIWKSRWFAAAMKVWMGAWPIIWRTKSCRPRLRLERGGVSRRNDGGLHTQADNRSSGQRPVRPGFVYWEARRQPRTSFSGWKPALQSWPMRF